MATREARATVRRDLYAYIQSEFNDGKELTTGQHVEVKKLISEHSRLWSLGIQEQLDEMLKSRHARKEAAWAKSKNYPKNHPKKSK